MTDTNGQENYKVSWKGWCSLIFICISFSGFLAADMVTKSEYNSIRMLSAIDFSILVGKFGTIAGSKHIFQGASGSGARDGFLFTLTLIPTVMLALGFIQVCESMGALRAAEKVFRPLLRPFLNVPGVAGLAFVSSFTSSDVGAVMTKELVENKMMTDDERTIFVSYQYAGSAVVTNTFGTGAPLIPITAAVMPVGGVIALIFVCKIIGAMLVRAYMSYYRKKHPLTEGGDHAGE